MNAMVAHAEAAAARTERILGHARRVGQEARLASIRASRLNRLSAIQFRSSETRRKFAALSGLKALRDLASQGPIQRLVDQRNGSIVLWHIADKYGYWNACIMLSEIGIELKMEAYGIRWGDNDSILGPGDLIKDESESILFAYDTMDPFLCWFPRLHKRLGSTSFDVAKAAKYWLRHGDGIDPMDMLFQVLVDCADPEKLERYVLNAF